MKKFAIIFTITMLGSVAFSQTLFSIRRHVQTPITNAEFDAEMADVNERLRIDNDRCNDVPCTARFQRSGNINTFGVTGDGLDVVTTAAELSAVMGIPDRVKVVTVIDFCGGTFNPSIIGCGSCGGDTYVVESWVSGEVYVHEYGHNILIHNCSHRTDCEHNIWDDDTDGTNDAVNQAECNACGGSMNTELYGNVYNGNGGPLSLAGGPYWITSDVVVPSSTTLTIEPGVEIQFKHDHKISANGTLNADGSTQNILLFSNSTGITGGPPPKYPSIRINGQIKLNSGGQVFLY